MEKTSSKPIKLWVLFLWCLPLGVLGTLPSAAQYIQWAHTWPWPLITARVAGSLLGIPILAVLVVGGFRLVKMALKKISM